MFFISKKHFRREVQWAIEQIDRQRTKQDIEDIFLKALQGNDLELFIDRLIARMSKKDYDKLKEDLVNKAGEDLKKSIEMLKRSIEFTNQYDHDLKWWQYHPFKETIGSEEFLEALVERINRKQVHGGNIK